MKQALTPSYVSSLSSLDPWERLYFINKGGFYGSYCGINKHKKI
jgi:hypothetical protein